MAVVADAFLDVADLERRLRQAEPAVRLVPERLLRRVIKRHNNLPGLGLQVPHRKSYVIDRDALLPLVERGEVPAEENLPSTVMLLARPDAGDLAGRPAREVLEHFSRLLFHCRVHAALEQSRQNGRLTAAEVACRVQKLGPCAWAEIRQVLSQEKFLLPPGDDASGWIEFAAVYLELRYFAPALTADYFPCLDPNADAIPAGDLDADALFAASRLWEGLDPTAAVENPAAADVEQEGATTAETPPAADTAASWNDQAGRAGASGNVVRAAFLRFRAEGPDAARPEFDRLAQRLAKALALDQADAQEWRQALPALLPRAARGFWTVEARLLYDLQKVCIDQEREVYAVDLVEWAASLGKLHMKRPLPALRQVQLVKHLRSAARRLLSARLPQAQRASLTRLLQSAIATSEGKLREHFRPLLILAMDDVGLWPRNLPEQVARDKLVEELLDRIAERGFLTMSDLRDALSRNQLKIPDLAGVGEFFLGDKLIRLNRRLAIVLDGVYHRGEIYRRWLQRFSALAFGTRPGRFLTRYLALPFGGAFVALEGIGHLLHVAGLEYHLANLYSVACLGVFLLGMLYARPFRQAVAAGLRGAGKGLRGLLVDAPAWVLERPVVRAVLQSKPVAVFGKYLLKPVLVASTVAAIGYLAGIDPGGALLLGLAVFAAGTYLLNSRLVRDAEEALLDWLMRHWQRIHRDLLPNLFRFVMDFFRRILDWAERVLYTVDEWFRFKSGEGRLALIVKPILGLGWFLVTYVVRFCLNLLIEPQINPIKHFPVVTVSHKLLLPLIPTFARLLSQTMDEKLAVAVATGVIFSIPGIFGFLVWELKENWRLYEANRPTTLKPVLVGSHGETVVRLLRPGFHSGTIPKLFAKLRRAARRGRGRASRRFHDALHHVEEGLHRFAERELVHLLEHSRRWAKLPLRVTEVALATNRIRLELACPDLGTKSMEIFLVLDDGQVMARIGDTGWLEQLSPKQRDAFTEALAGWLQWAGACQVPELVAPGPIAWGEWVKTWSTRDEA
jgi:hypothetical protein